jgi:hypothetical protein
LTEDEKDKVTVQVKYGGVEESFSGSLEDVWLSVNKFFSEFLPSFDVAKKLMLNVDLQRLVENCRGIVAFSAEGANLLVSRDKLTDNETLMLWLLSAYVGFRLGLLKRDVFSKDELQVKLGKSAKITSTRLGELVKDGLVLKVDESYRVSTLCVVQMQKDVLPRIQSKLQA